MNAEFDQDRSIEISGAEKQPFALDGYKYTQQDLDGFMGKISSATSIRTEEYYNSLREGGGKAFGLQVCQEVAKKFHDREYRLRIPYWEIVKDLQSVELDSWRYILRSSAPTEDWLDSRSGTLQSFDLTDTTGITSFEYQREKHSLPNIPYVIQTKMDGLGMVIDVGYSPVSGRIVSRVACGNKRRSDFGYTYLTSATNDSEASVAIWDAQIGEFVTPGRSFHSEPEFIKSSTPGNNFIQPLYQALVELGIDFGVQLEIIMDPDRPNILQLVQIRPTPGQIYHKISTAVDQNEVGTKQQIALSAIVNGAFRHIGEPVMFERGDIDNNFKRSQLKQRIARGKVGIYLKRGGSWGNFIVKPDHASTIFLGGYMSGCDIQLTPGAISPNTKHGDITVSRDVKDKYNELDTQCGMVSLREPEIQEIKKQVETGGGKIEIVSDGLIASVSVVKLPEEISATPPPIIQQNVTESTCYNGSTE